MSIPEHEPKLTANDIAGFANVIDAIRDSEAIPENDKSHLFAALDQLGNLTDAYDPLSVHAINLWLPEILPVSQHAQTETGNRPPALEGPQPHTAKGLTMTGMFEHDRQIPKGLVGLPVTELRARELAFTVAANLSDDDEAIAALVELLLGVAPCQLGASELLHEASLRRLRDKSPEPYDPATVGNLMGDLWTRYTALLEAVAVLYTFTDTFKAAVERYAASLGRKSNNKRKTAKGEK